MKAGLLRSGAGAVVLLAAAWAALTPASANVSSGVTASIRNGEIAFFRQRTFYGEGPLYAVSPDGSRVRRLLKSALRIRSAAWSPDGRRLAVVDQCAIKVGRASGGMLRTIVRPRSLRGSTGHKYTDCFASLEWSPDGTKLVFTRCATALCPGDGGALFVVEASGRGLRQLTQRECVLGRAWRCPWLQDTGPSWSPDGKSIVFSRLDVSLPDPLNGNWANHARLYRIDPDGSGLAPLSPQFAWAPRWSRDGSRIAFWRTVWRKPPPGATASTELRVVNADGTGERTLVEELVGPVSWCTGTFFDWSPDGTKAVVTGPCPRGIYVMDADGGNRVAVMRDPRLTGVVAWRPLP